MPERAEQVTVGQHVHGVDVDIICTCGLREDGILPPGQLRMIGAPPVEDHPAAPDFLDVGGMERLSVDFTVKVAQQDVVVGIEEIEVVTVRRKVLPDMPGGFQADLGDRVVMLVEQDADARVVAGKYPGLILGIERVVAVVNLPVIPHMLLEIPPAGVVVAPADGVGFIAVIKQPALVVVFLDQAEIDER